MCRECQPCLRNLHSTQHAIREHSYHVLLARRRSVQACQVQVTSLYQSDVIAECTLDCTLHGRDLHQ